MPGATRVAVPLARRVREAVDAAERRICGDGAVASAAAAEGLALAGCRAARVFGPVSRGQDDESGAPCLPVGWVDHRIRDGAGTTGAWAFELVASAPQEAVDLCLVAHRVAARIGRAGLCTVDPALAAAFAVTWLPDERAIAELPAAAAAGAAAVDAPPDLVERETLAAFAAVAAATRRAIGPIVRTGPLPAERVLIGVGAGGVLARETAELLCQVDVPCAAVTLTQLDPFPAAALGEALAGVQSVAVLGDARDPFAARLGRRVRGALGRGADVRLVTALRGGGTEHVLASLELLWRTDLSEAIAREPEPVVGARVGAHPGGRSARELLLDAVAPLAWLSDVRIDCVSHPADDVVAVAVGDHPVHANGPLDLLLVTDPTRFRGEAALRRLREGGTLLCCMPPQGALFLTEAQRSVVAQRGLRVRAIGEHAPARVAAALLAATSDLAVGKGAKDLIGTLVAAMPEALETERLELLAGAAALEDPAGGGAPPIVDDEPASGPPLVPDARPAEPSEALRQALRAFHFAGTVPAHGQAARPAEVLRPVAFPVPDASVGAPLAADAQTLYERWAERVGTDRRRRRVTFAEDAGALIERLRAALGGRVALDPASGDGPALAASLGQLGGAFLDPEQLRQTLSRPPAQPVATVPAERSGRLGSLLDDLIALTRRLRATPVAHVLVRDLEQVTERDDTVVTRHDDPLRAAIGLFDGLARQASADARTMRAARLEVEGAFDAALHGPRLERLDWASLRADERLLCPAIVVVESARRLRGPALAALSELVRSGRGVHVLVTESVTDVREELLDERAGFHPGLGYLMMAHREALVVQTTPGCARHLAAGLDLAATSLDPVVIVAAAASPDLPWPAPVQLEAALRSRALPCFRYDPAAGVSWAERFALEANPQPDGAWPLYTVACVDAAGTPHELREAFTFAHAAALDPGWRDHFLVVGPAEWLDDQLPIAEWLELADRERGRAVPFVQVVDAGGRVARALVRWELALACRDRAQAWRLLQELGGTHDVYAERAAEQARREVQQQHAERVARLDAEHAKDLAAARERSAEAAIERLVWAFVDPDQAVPTQIAVASAAAGLAVAAMPAAPLVLPPGAAAPAATGAPYIDSFLCTSCNDCINLNPRLFVYNDDKQATIGDAAKGTYGELVKAAEACPARCIHPGAPRPGDKTATPKLVERAARFG